MPLLQWHPSEVRMWTSLLVLVAVVYLTIWIGTGSPLIANLTVLPCLGPLICGPLWANPVKGGPLRLLFFTLFVYALFTSWIKMWPNKCRTLWKQHLSYDPDWNVTTAMLALEKEEGNIAPGAAKGSFDTWVKNVEAAHGVNTTGMQPATGEFLHLNRRLEEVDPAFALPAARSLDQPIAIAPAVDPAAATTAPPTTGATGATGSSAAPVIVQSVVFTTPTPVNEILPRPHLVSDRELTLYCSFHRKDERDTWPGFEILSFTGQCDPAWTCTFTQQRAGGTWKYWLALLAGVLLNSLHSCMDQDSLEWLIGAGQCRLWWAWFWAGLIPLWGVSFVTKVKGVNNGTFMEWLWKAVTVIIDDAQAMIIIGSVSFVAILLVANREVIYRTLGIDDRKLLHWINADRVSGAKKRRIFQVCVWRIDLESQEAEHDYTDFTAQGMQGLKAADDGLGPSARTAGLPQGVDGPETQGLLGGILGGGGAAARAPSPPRGGTTLGALRNAATGGGFFTSSAGKADPNRLLVNDDGNVNLFVRLAYGDNEPQTTCVQRMTSSLDNQGVIYYQETFRLNFDGSDLPLNVQICDQQLMSYKRLGSCHFSRDMLEENFRWSKKRENVLRNRIEDSGFSDPIAGEQVVVMMQAANNASQRSGTWNKSEQGRETRYRMMNVGFRPYVLNEGGAVWLAFAEIGGRSDGGLINGVIGGLTNGLSSWWS